MPRQVTIAILALVMLVASGSAYGQNFMELGLMSGTGVVFMPTGLTSPNAQFRVDISRLGLTSKAGRGMNLVGASVGLSRFVEGYVRYSSEQSGLSQTTDAVGFGGKLTIPIVFPIVKIVSFWGEFSTSQSGDRSRFFPPSYARGAMIVTPFTNGVRPSFLIGVSRRGDESNSLMAGASVVLSPWHKVQFGAEYLHGYMGWHSDQAALNASIRAFSNICLHAGPGYLTRPGTSGWFWTAGLSFHTSDIDFHPVAEPVKQEYKLPTIEELEHPEKTGQGSGQGDGAVNLDNRETDSTSVSLPVLPGTTGQEPSAPASSSRGSEPVVPSSSSMESTGSQPSAEPGPGNQEIDQPRKPENHPL